MVLSNNHTTPHQTTDVAPAILLLKRPVCNKLLRDNHVDPVSGIVHERDSSHKFKFKVHANRRAYVKPSVISPGETVLVRRPFTASKGATVYEPTPLTVVDKKGSMVTAKNKNSTVTRNFCLKKVWARQPSTVRMMHPMTLVTVLMLTSGTNKSFL